MKSIFMNCHRFFRCRLSAIAALAVHVSTASFAAAEDVADFKSPLDGSPMTFVLQSREVETPIVKKFKETGVNDYRADADGKNIDTSDCIACHGVDRRDCPTSVGKDVIYKQVLTDRAMFAIIYGGASGAMQSFHRRGINQGEILRIIAYVRTLDK